MEKMAKTFKRYVLYIGQDFSDPAIFCPGSRQAMKLIEPIKEDVSVQSIDVLLEKGVELPSWLTGTPTLVATDSRMAYIGSECIDELKRAVNGGKQSEQARTYDDMLGAPASGARFEQAEFEMDTSQSQMQANGLMDKEGKVTDEDVQRYMNSRNASMPQQTPMQ